ncbi:hypothetical protein [Ralstonia pseudosolanacearum]|uniref:hypothetical protein n=1 Tax=Ralstonia pseudosolanacearum TaxID=1310165 RepID=UPI001FF7241B|nr:hypothetical protein [Ralstonia pseudosolanacearum]
MPETGAWISAIFGLLGVVVGAILTIAKDWLFLHKKNSKDREYLAIQVSCLLDQYVTGCSDVVGDDGLCQGQTNRMGCHEAQVAVPHFEPNLLAVEWKSLPADLMSEVLSLPFKAKQVAEWLAGVSQYSEPPEYEEWFEERQYQYAQLGIEAASLAERLRDHVKVRFQPLVDWDPVTYMRRRKEEIEQRKKERDEINRRFPLS